jgi:CRISPR/Cas system-associated exonuclease Cas4 (RecB family)
VLQRAENISLFYNSETDVLGQGEMSRYLQQLIYESGLKVERAVMHQPVQPLAIQPIVIQKDQAILDRLAQLGEEGSYKHKGISPSALNAYIECRLRFYFRYVARIKEPREVEEDLDARVLGDFLHKVMERFYKRLRERKQSKEVVPEDFDQYEKEVSLILDDVFRDAYRLDPDKPVIYEGQRLIVREMIVRFVSKIMKFDKDYAPFVLEAVEQEGMTYQVKLDHAPGTTLLGGVIDRADYKDDVLRIIDYKTGRDELDFASVASLFEREGKRNKAAFQTMLYALLVQKNFKALPGRLLPGLLNRKNLFDDNFTFGLRKDKEILNDIGPLLPEFEEHLKKLLDDLYDPNTVFDQTTEELNCSYCPYKAICYR